MSKQTARIIVAVFFFLSGVAFVSTGIFIIDGSAIGSALAGGAFTLFTLFGIAGISSGDC